MLHSLINLDDATNISLNATLIQEKRPFQGYNMEKECQERGKTHRKSIFSVQKAK